MQLRMHALRRCSHVCGVGARCARFCLRRSVYHELLPCFGQVALTEASELVRDLYDGREVVINF